MDGRGGGPLPVLHTPRLRLRPLAVEDAPLLRELWTERDPRVPSHRRIDAEGRPTVEDLEASLRDPGRPSAGLLAVELADGGEAVGYCGLVDGGPGGVEEPELAFELLRRVWGRGYATEAALGVLDLALERGHARLWATVWDWNHASLRVLTRIGFVQTPVQEVVPGHGLSLLLVMDL